MTVQRELPLEFSTEFEDGPTGLGPGASFASGLPVGLFFDLNAALYGLLWLGTA